MLVAILEGLAKEADNMDDELSVKKYKGHKGYVDLFYPVRGGDTK